MNWKGFMKTVHPANTKSKSLIEILPVLDADPNSYTAIHTTLLNCVNQSDTNPGAPIIVTFDFPLWIRATEIVLSLKMPIVVRLGGFHLLKSFLGSVGHVMSGSGIEDAIKLVFPLIGDSTVSHIMSGGAYYKALRCLFLIDAALVTHLMKGSLSDEELKVVRTTMKSSLDDRSGSGQMTGAVLKFKEILEQKLIDLPTTGRTPRLWIQFHSYVTVIKAFIRAERMHLIDLHFSCVVEMLPTFAAAGHTKYAKGARLYLEQMSEHMKKYKNTFDVFLSEGYHTVRYNSDEWSGTWSDIAIEQTVMKSAKSSGGLTGGRMRGKNSTHNLWCCTLDHMSSINHLMGSSISDGVKKDVPHVDARKSSMKRDSEIVDQLMLWFSDNDPFDCSRNSSTLVSFHTGLVSNDDTSINPEKSAEIGVMIQKSHDGMSYEDTMHSKLKVRPLANLTKKPVKVNGKDVYIDTLKLFTRLMIIGERELSVKDSLCYELTPLPTALFDDKQGMRKTNKAALGTVLKTKFPSTTSENLHVQVEVVDGGWLIYKVGL